MAAMEVDAAAPVPVAIAPVAAPAIARIHAVGDIVMVFIFAKAVKGVSVGKNVWRNGVVKRLNPDANHIYTIQCTRNKRKKRE